MMCVVILLANLVFTQAEYDYAELIRYSLLFYEAQRSGKLPADQKVTWRKDSALNDKGQNGEDLTGGYYDAGDFMKFGFPMAFTTTVLSWGIIANPNGYNKAGAMDDARKAVKWATDYFLKAHVSDNKLYGQVGQGSVDHSYWGRPEDMTMQRPAYYIDQNNPGSDLAGETAAALAAASIVFKNVDSSYANTLLSHAKTLFNFASKYRGIYSNAITDAANFYRSSGFQDELVWAAVWLYKAANDKNYLDQAQQLYQNFGLEREDGGFDWDQKISGAEVLLAEVTGQESYKNKVKGYCDWMQNNQQRTPKGLVFINAWGSLRHAANVVFICLQAKNLGLNYTSFARQQIGYILGDTGRSFVVGFGNNPPSHVHHTSSSCPDAPKPCDWDTYSSPDPNAHVLYGALVGGPDQNDNYQDVRSDYQHNEVACDYNAGYQSALAALLDL